MTNTLKNSELRVLSSICSIIDKALSLESALEEVLRILSDTLGMKRGAVILADPGTGLLSISVSHGLSPEEKRRGVYSPDEGVTGHIFQTAKPYFTRDIRKDPRFLNRTGARGSENGPVSFTGVPVLLSGRPMGVLTVDRLFGPDVCFEEDVRLLTVVATLIAQFISLNEQVEKRVEGLRRENARLKSRLTRVEDGPSLVGVSVSMGEVMRQVEKVAATRATVLLLGESGTGKTLAAHVIHELSDRKSGPFVPVNCAAIPENLLESELFGHEKGAFTGASAARAGRFEDAGGGTIFLDEIGELPLTVQGKLLRIVQEREFERLGSNATRKADVRIVAATNRDLARLAEEGRFRQDLYYRMNVFPISVPPLRERREDIPRLLNHFLAKIQRSYNRRLAFSPEALDILKDYSWPGNAREMENMVERLVILTEGGRIEAGLIRFCLGAGGAAPPGGPAVPGKEKARSLADTEREELLTALRANGWIQRQAARALGISERQMGYKVKKHGLLPRIMRERAAASEKEGRES
jgi:Nif-specific regulatory protein